MSDFGHFGNISKNYASGRRGYPEAVFYYLKLFCKVEAPVLDLGCGTGISTRQLALYGFQNVQGVDSDADMLYEAQEHGSYKSISYWHMAAKDLNFRSQAFKCITCFSSFHWFMDNESMLAIRRVLKNDGLVFIVQKVDTTPFKDEVKRLIEEKLQIQFEDIASMDEIKNFLEKNRFRMSPQTEFEGEDLYSMPEALDYIQSTSYWAAIDESQRIPLLDTIVKPYLETIKQTHKSEKNRIIRRYKAVVLIAHKT